MTRTVKTFGQLISYFSKQNFKDKHEPTFSYLRHDKATAREYILHNLRSISEDAERINAEFAENARYAKQRKGGVVLYHEVLAFSREDAQVATPDVIGDITRRYLEMRAPSALAYARVHRDTGAPHVHILISGNLIKSDKKLRLSKGQFSSVKRDIEAYQIHHHPRLSHSIAQRGGKKLLRETITEDARRRRQASSGDITITRKEQVARLATHCLASDSPIQCEAGLAVFGMSLYQRGKQYGIRDKDGRKYRLSTLGLASHFEQALEAWADIADRTEFFDRAIEEARRARSFELGADISRGRIRNILEPQLA